MSAGRKAHWDQIYRDKAPEQLSWRQDRPELSLEMIQACELETNARVLDVGGGAARLVDCLLDAGFRQVSVLDVSPVALEHARARLGAQALSVEWIEADATSFELDHEVDIWHDRAVFHFLSEPADRTAYLSQLDRYLSPQGQAIIATFTLEGPERCSNLPVVRYSAETLAQTLGAKFRLVESRAEQHLTPSGVEQPFLYHRFCRH